MTDGQKKAVEYGMGGLVLAVLGVVAWKVTHKAPSFQPVVWQTDPNAIANPLAPPGAPPAALNPATGMPDVATIGKQIATTVLPDGRLATFGPAVAARSGRGHF